MKHLFALLLSTFLFVGLNAQEAVDAPKAVSGAAITFETTEVDYGTIEQNSDPYREFKFTNTGTEPLIIKSAKGSCGCTVPEYPKEPTMPGESNIIKVRYDTKRIGTFNKSVTITTNAGTQNMVLKIKGKVNKAVEEVIPAEEKDVF